MLSVVGVTLVAPAEAPGQAGAPLPGMMPTGVFLPSEMGECCDGFRVGHWVEYLAVRQPGARRWHMRMATVGREGESWWVEMTMSEARRGDATCKILVDPGASDRDGRLKRVIIQPEGHMPLELPPRGAAKQIPAPEVAAGEGSLVGRERLKVRAGTFETKHYRRGEGESAQHVWMSERVGLWGLVKYRSSQVRLTLLGQGTGAVSRIVDEPVPFDPASIR